MHHILHFLRPALLLSEHATTSASGISGSNEYDVSEMVGLTEGYSSAIHNEHLEGETLTANFGSPDQKNYPLGACDFAQADFGGGAGVVFECLPGTFMGFHGRRPHGTCFAVTDEEGSHPASRQKYSRHQRYMAEHGSIGIVRCRKNRTDVMAGKRLSQTRAAFIGNLCPTGRLHLNGRGGMNPQGELSYVPKTATTWPRNQQLASPSVVERAKELISSWALVTK